MNIEIFQRKREFDSVKGEDQQDHSSFQSFFFNKKTLLMSFKLNKNNNWLKIHSILKNNLENWNFDLGMDSWNKWKIKFTTHFIFVNNLQCDLIDLENEKKSSTRCDFTMKEKTSIGISRFASPTLPFARSLITKSVF